MSLFRDPYPWQDPEFWKPSNIAHLIIDAVAFVITVAVIAGVIGVIQTLHILT